MPEARPLSREESEQLRAHIARDHRRALEVDKEARRVRQSPVTVVTPDITGKPDIAAQRLEWNRERLRGLEALDRELFFAKVEGRVTTGRDVDAPICLLVTKARGVSTLDGGDDWGVVSWTDPLSQLVDMRPGDARDFPITNRRPARYRVEATGRFDTVVPKLLGAQYTLDIGEYFLATEDELAVVEISAPEAPPPIEYKAAEIIGLGDIIASVDGIQRAAMHLPFDAHVLIEGPPGSGKTSVGLMRIACLLDQQWLALKLDRAKDRAFHKTGSMRVLVFNQEMVEYLRTLVHSTGVQGVRVQTTRAFTQDLCRAAGTLKGKLARDKPLVEAIKSQREMLAGYWVGFRKNLAATWEKRYAALSDTLSQFGNDGLQALKLVEEWVTRVANAATPGVERAPLLNIAEPLARWRRTLEQSVPQLDDDRSRKAHVDQIIRGVREVVDEFLREATDRRSITMAMFTTDEYQILLDRVRQLGLDDTRIARAERRWRDQYKGEAPTYSEYDAIAAAWLGLHITLVTTPGLRPLVGGTLDALTHVVIDEAQDLSPAHLALVGASLVADGTMTIVGDLRQNLNTGAGLRHWDELKLPVERRAFEVNYRQSAELGRFLQALHEAFYQETPVWRPTDRWYGPLPQAAKVKSWQALADQAAAACRQAKELVPGCTIAVLYDKRIQPKRLEWLRQELDTQLQDLLPVVQLVDPKSRGSLRDTESIVIASVLQTKGLEFDAVVYIDPQPRWSGEPAELPLRLRNGFYVAASRARQFLSMHMGSLPACLPGFAEQGLCELTLPESE